MTAPSSQKKLFLSYSSAQAAWARTLHDFLVEALPGIEVFFDQGEIRPGDQIQEHLEAALQSSSALLLLASPEALSSQWVLEELKRARDHAQGSTRVLVTAQIVPVELPTFLTSARVADLTQESTSFDSDLRDLFQSLSERLGLPAPGAIGTLSRCSPRLAESVREPLDLLLQAGLARSPSRALVCIRMKWPEDVLEPFQALGGVPLAAQAAWTRVSRSRKGRWLAGEELLDAAQSLVDVVQRHDPGELDSEAEAASQAIAAERERLRAPGREAPDPAAPDSGADLHALLARYLTALEDEHRDLIPLAESSGRNERVEHVYVELALAERERLHETRESSARVGAIGLVELLDFERDAERGLTGRWLLRGDPGSGKSTLLRHFAYKCACGVEPGWLPVFLPLVRQFRERFTPDLEADSLAQFESRPNDALRDAWSTLLREHEQRGELLLLLDGLDEVPTELADNALAWLRALARDWPGAQVVVTTRRIGYRRPSTDFVEVDLQPLGREQGVDLIAHWLPLKDGSEDRQRAEQLAEELTRVQSLRELAGNPLHLTLFALLASDPASAVSPVERRSELFERILGLLCRGGHKPHPDPKTPFANADVRKALRHLAYGTTVDDRLEMSKEDLQDRLDAQERLCAKLAALGDWGEDRSLFLNELAKHTSILGPYVAGPDGPWRFLHKSFREALTAEQLARRVEQEGLEPVLEEARNIEGDEGRWAEPFALLAGAVQDADALITALEEARPSLARAALATAEGVGVATAERMLGLKGDIRERGRVILGLVNRMESAEDGVRMLARMATESRDGNDLYFYYEALRAAEQQPECASLARDARRHFFDHVPAPADLTPFQRIETCEGERDLWRRVEAGVYSMGSPDDVGDSDEHPRHEVELTRPFRIGVVPVTNALLLELYPDHSTQEHEGRQDEFALLPATHVTWYEAMTFARWVTWALEGREHFERHGDWMGTLPSEAMWEVACRAENSGTWCFGDDEKEFGEYAWYDSNSGGRSHPVGRKSPNGWGIHDMHGNSWEWCRDAWRREYAQGRAKDPEQAGGELRDSRVVRGGSFLYVAWGCRSAYRNYGDPWVRNRVQGFRVALPAEP